MSAVNTNNAFLRAINEASNEQRAAVLAELEQYKKRELEAARLQAREKAEEYIAAQTGKLAAEDGVASAKRSAELRASVISTRSEIAENVFSKAAQKLADFTQSESYLPFLISSAKKMAELCSNSPMTLYLREQDMKFAEKLKEAVPSAEEISAENSVTLGGIIGLCREKNIRMNDTLEVRLEEEKEKFFENSGLTL